MIILLSLLIIICTVAFTFIIYEGVIEGNCWEGVIIINVIIAFIILLFTLDLIGEVDKKDFEDNKQVIYVKPPIKIVDKTEEKVIYYIDGDIYTYIQHKYYNTNNLWKEIEFYKEKTNTSIIYRKNP